MPLSIEEASIEYLTPWSNQHYQRVTTDITTLHYQTHQTQNYTNDAWWRVWHANIYMSRSWNVNTRA